MSETKSKLGGWFADRFPVDAFRDFAEKQAKKPLPRHVSWAHTFGSIALYLMFNQIITGILLMVYYRPTTELAYESVQHITTKAQVGWLIRGLHAWGSTLMIIALLLHMLRTFIMGAFKKPRELTWVVGVAIFGTVLTFGFTGYLLPWNQLSYWATTVGTEVLSVIPWVGDFIKYLLRGGDAVGGETLSRFYVVHVVVLPWILVGLVVLHLFLVRLQGLSTMKPVDEEKPLAKGEGIPFFPHHVLKELMIFSVFFAFLIGIVVLLPTEVGERADPFTTPEGIKPEWYFLPTYQLLKYFPKALGIFVSIVPILLLFVWPFLDRSRYKRPRQRPWSMTLGMSALVIALIFGVVGYFSEREIELNGTVYHIDEYGIPHRIEAQEAGQEEGSLPEEGATPGEASGGSEEDAPASGEKDE